MVSDRDGSATAASMAAKVALRIITASVAAADRLHDWWTRRLTAAPRTAFGSHVTLLTNPDTDLSTARVVTYNTQPTLRGTARWQHFNKNNRIENDTGTYFWPYYRPAHYRLSPHPHPVPTPVSTCCPYPLPVTLRGVVVPIPTPSPMKGTQMARWVSKKKEKHIVISPTRSSATAKSTARPSCLVGVGLLLWHI